MFWYLSPREFHALRDIQQAPTVRWAIGQATLANASFATDGVPFIADDFMGYGDRDKRKQENSVHQLIAARAELKTAAQIKKRKAGEPEPEWLPEWARMTPEEEERLSRNAR